MFKPFVLAVLTAMTLWTGLQFKITSDLTRELDRATDEVRRLTTQVNSLEAILSVHQDFIRANGLKISELIPKKVLRVTAYSPRKQETDDTPFKTATNKRVRHGIIAVSRDLFDSGWVFGRKVYIKGMGVFTIDDLMAKDKRNHIDIFMFDTEGALEFGVKHMEVYLLDA